MQICKKIYGDTEETLSIDEEKDSIILEIERDDPNFNHAYRESITLSVADAASLQRRLTEFLHRNGCASSL